jgi:hypothetical protein
MIITGDIHDAVYLGINFHFIFGPNTTTRDYTAKVKSSLVFINYWIDTNCSILILLNGSKPSRLHDYLLKMYPKSVTGISSIFSTQTIG